MHRPSKIIIDANALLHNLARIRAFAPQQHVIAMVKANAYGCGIDQVAPVLEGKVDAFGVACLEEALKIKSLNLQTPCLILQGIFHRSELEVVSQCRFDLVLHQDEQLHWLLETPLQKSIKVWIKVNTGMNRLGFRPEAVFSVLERLQGCPWVDKDLGLMTHFACADEPERPENACQIDLFNTLSISGVTKRSMANSAAIMRLPESHFEVVRPGIMLYGVSPFANQTPHDLDLKPVMQFRSAIMAIQELPAASPVGYQGTWSSDKPLRLGIVAAGYGDGYPRHIAPFTPVWIQGSELPIVGLISMDSLAVDLTGHPEINLGDPVELWGAHLFVERIAKAASTIPYELLCQITNRPRH